MSAFAWAYLLGAWVGFITAPLVVQVAMYAVDDWLERRRWHRIGPAVAADLQSQGRRIALLKERYR